MPLSANIMNLGPWVKHLTFKSKFAVKSSEQQSSKQQPKRQKEWTIELARSSCDDDLCQGCWESLKEVGKKVCPNILILKKIAN